MSARGRRPPSRFPIATPLVDWFSTRSRRKGSVVEERRSQIKVYPGLAAAAVDLPFRPGDTQEMPGLTWMAAGF